MDGTSSAEAQAPRRATEQAADTTDLTVDVDLEARPTATDLHDAKQRDAVERALLSVPDILGARLVPGFDRHIDELHVLTGLARAPKQTVRDVQTLLLARFGIPTDHRVISIVQLDEGHGLPTVTRAVIEEVRVTATGHSVTADVALRDVDVVHRGSAQGSATAKGRTRAVAAATIDAVGGLLGGEPTLELDGVEVVGVATHEVAIATIEVTTARTSTVLTGSALVRDAAPEAIVRAVLDALNRLMSGAD